MTKEKKNGPTKAQLQAKVRRLERELAKFQRGDRVRREGEHWYKLECYFDGEGIVRTPGPWKDPVFLMGMLEDIYVVEVPAGSDQDQIDGFMQLLRRNGIAPALAVVRGVQFLKLTSVDEETEAELDAEVESAAQSETPTGETSDDGGPRPEPNSDGVGGVGSEDGTDPNGRSDRDEKGGEIGTVDGGA